MCPSVRSHLTNLDIRSINSDHFPWNLLLKPTTFLPVRWQHLSLSLTGVATREREILNSREMNDLLPPHLCKEVAQNRFLWDRRIDTRRYGRSIPDAMNRFFFCQSSFWWWKTTARTLVIRQTLSYSKRFHRSLSVRCYCLSFSKKFLFGKFFVT